MEHIKDVIRRMAQNHDHVISKALEVASAPANEKICQGCIRPFCMDMQDCEDISEDHGHCHGRCAQLDPMTIAKDEKFN